ncbi:MAG: NAD-dependent dehydratase [Bacteroidetes bacterium]|nr:NAD-dependent dehydratase [Bacteroidota bacterium]MCL5266648.1 NAD-dependent dehydratase [Bacteroidota bacterium]
MSNHTILGAGGVVADELARLLVSEGEIVRLVSRGGHGVNGATSLKADVSSADQTAEAVKDSNVYAYGKVEGAMTESTPYDPCSKKGEIRAAIATRLMDEAKAGNIHALIARAADFYGPFADKVAIPNMLVFNRLAGGKKPNILVNGHTKHSYTYTLDIAQALFTLANSEAACDQVWHLPTSPGPLTGREFVELAAKEFGGVQGYTVLSRWMLKAAGLFDRTIYEIVEMLYQNEHDYIFDSSKFTNAFGITATSYTEGIRQTVKSYQTSANRKEQMK